jgi:hypothetical protein
MLPGLDGVSWSGIEVVKSWTNCGERDQAPAASSMHRPRPQPCRCFVAAPRTDNTSFHTAKATREILPA